MHAPFKMCDDEGHQRTQQEERLEAEKGGGTNAQRQREIIVYSVENISNNGF